MKKQLLILAMLMNLSSLQAMKNQNSEDLKQKAEKGHAEAMWSLAQRCFGEGKYEEGTKWKNRYAIRVRQDQACSEDPSVGAVWRDAAQAWGWTHPGEQQKILQTFPTEKDLYQQFLKDVEWIRKLTPESLPEPTWINRSGLFIPMNECNRKRRELLDRYVQAFKDQYSN